MNAREAAFGAVYAFLEKRRPLDAAIREAQLNLGRREDRALAAEIALGTVENLRIIDLNIDCFSKAPVAKQSGETRTILRISAYQLFYLDRVPAYSVLNEAVELAKKKGAAASFVNAVLRKLTENVPVLYTQKENLALNFSLSDSLAEFFTDSYGLDKAESILKAFGARRGFCIVVNSLLIERRKYAGRLSAAGVEHEWMFGDLIRLRGRCSPQDLPGYGDGLFFVQDAASYLAVSLLSPREGDVVVDLCASPGGKSFAANTIVKGKAQIFAYDISEKKVAAIKENAERLKFENISASVADAKLFSNGVPQADRVICDVPCSCYGTIGKKPEIRFKETKDAARYPEIQLQMLKNAARYLKKGGALVYSTCTLSAAENERVVDGFLKENPDFSPDDYRGFLPGRYHKNAGNYLTLLPDEDETEGFFMARLTRKN